MRAVVSTVMKKGEEDVFHKIALEKNMLNLPSPCTVVRNKI